MAPVEGGPYHVLILCTGNSARSQMAEALFNTRGRDRVRAESAGSQPAARVNPYAIRALSEIGLDWSGRTPRGLDEVSREGWDFVITVCDRAREACPIFPGTPVVAHWGMPDPAEVEGNDEQKLQVFRDTLLLLARRIDLFLALPVEKLDRLSLEARTRAIGGTT